MFVGYIDEHGEEREASYRCRRFAASRSPHPDGLCSNHQRGRRQERADNVLDDLGAAEFKLMRS